MALLVISLLDEGEQIFFKGAYGQNVALAESNAKIGLASATTTLHIFCVYIATFNSST